MIVISPMRFTHSSITDFGTVRDWDSFLCDTILIIKGETLQFFDKPFLIKTGTDA